MIPTFRPWTHTSDDSYIYQLSLVVATATVSFPEEIIREYSQLPVVRGLFRPCAVRAVACGDV